MLSAFLHYCKTPELAFSIMQKLWCEAGIKRNFTTYEDAEKFNIKLTETIIHRFPNLV